MDIVVKVRSSLVQNVHIQVRVPLEGSILLVRLQPVVITMEAFQSLFTVLCKIWSTGGRDGPGEKSWFPLCVGGLSFCGFRSLLLLDLGLEVGRKSILSAYYSSRDIVPELEGFVGKLFLERRYNLGDWIERIEIDDKVLLLKSMLVQDIKDIVEKLTETLLKGLLPSV
jgi:hypothetical protein